jgi:hypothetical protein
LDSFRIHGFAVTGGSKVEDVVFVTLSFAARSFSASVFLILTRERRFKDRWL